MCMQPKDASPRGIGGQKQEKPPGTLGPSWLVYAGAMSKTNSVTNNMEGWDRNSNLSSLVPTCAWWHSSTSIHICTHTYMHTCAHTCIHSHMHTCIHTYVQMYAQTLEVTEYFADRADSE